MAIVGAQANQSSGCGQCGQELRTVGHTCDSCHRLYHGICLREVGWTKGAAELKRSRKADVGFQWFCDKCTGTDKSVVSFSDEVPSNDGAPVHANVENDSNLAAPAKSNGASSSKAHQSSGLDLVTETLGPTQPTSATHSCAPAELPQRKLERSELDRSGNPPEADDLNVPVAPSKSRLRGRLTKIKSIITYYAAKCRSCPLVGAKASSGSSLGT